MKIKTDTLTGAALDWAVTKIELDRRTNAGEYVKAWARDDILAGRQADPYSTDWLWGGPIVERERITLETHISSNEWKASIRSDERPALWHGVYGPTPLVAAMRCFVASKMGDEVDIPEGL